MNYVCGGGMNKNYRTYKEQFKEYIAKGKWDSLDAFCALKHTCDIGNNA